MSALALAIVDAALAMKGTPFVHQGRLPGVGLDCIGLVGMAGLLAGVPNARDWRADPSCHNYARQPEPKSLLRNCAKYFDPVKSSREMRAGDVVLMKFQLDPMHFALVRSIEPRYVVHALYSARRVCEHRLDAQWLSCVMRVFRFRGVE